MIDAKTRLVALFGNPVAHSIGPAMHNAAFKHLQLNYAYLAFRVENIETAVAAMKSLNFAGCSVTIPHKEKILPLLDSVEETAKKIGAVNTVVNNNGELVGYNTDCDAAISVLKKRTRLAGKRVALVGAGGAAKAIAFGLQRENALTTIFNRTMERAEQLANAVKCGFAPMEKLQSFEADILINATSLGMFPNVKESPVSASALKKGLVVFDIVYNPIETLLLKQAKQNGCKTISGIEMFVEQGAKQFELWTKQKAPKELMKNTALKELETG